jgi:predicted kinase
LPSCTFVVVSGSPASGKTTLARAIASELNLPLIAKDAIKEALMSVLPVPDGKSYSTAVQQRPRQPPAATTDSTPS